MEPTAGAVRFSNSDLPLFAMAGGFGMWKAWRDAGCADTPATYDLLVRELPRNRNLLVFAGLEEALGDILSWSFSPRDIDTLLKYKVIDEEIAAELVGFRFDVTIEAMREGTIFFPGEPVMKLSGPLYKLELLYLYLLTVVSSNTIFSSKCIRIVMAAKDKKFFLPGARAQSFESCFKCMRSMYICGGYPSSSQLGFWNKFNLDPQRALVAPTHAFIKSFVSEEAAMETFARTFRDSLVPVLIDTFDFEQGVEKFIRVYRKIESEGTAMVLPYIDSGDLTARALYVRRRLDEEGLQRVGILASGNLDEYKVQELVEKAPIDMFLGLTEVVNSVDAPSLEVIYKLAELGEGENRRGVMKLSAGKVSLPGRKQVFRQLGEDGRYSRDVIGLEDDEISGQRLLEKMVDGGRLLRPLPSLDEIREYVGHAVSLLPERLRRLGSAPYPVEISERLAALADETRRTATHRCP